MSRYSRTLTFVQIQLNLTYSYITQIKHILGWVTSPKFCMNDCRIRKRFCFLVNTLLGWYVFHKREFFALYNLCQLVGLILERKQSKNLVYILQRKTLLGQNCSLTNLAIFTKWAAGNFQQKRAVRSICVYTDEHAVETNKSPEKICDEKFQNRLDVYFSGVLRSN